MCNTVRLTTVIATVLRVLFADQQHLETLVEFEVTSNRVDSSESQCSFRNCSRLLKDGAVLQGEWRPQLCAAACRMSSVAYPAHDKRAIAFPPIENACWAPCHTELYLDVVGIPTIRMEPAAVRECVKGRLIAVAGNSVSRILAWGMHNIATNYSLLERYPDEPALWGDEERKVDPFWGAGGEAWLEELAGEASNDEIDPAIMNQISRAITLPKLLYDAPRDRPGAGPWYDDIHFINQAEFDLTFLRMPKIFYPGPVDATWAFDRALESVMSVWGRFPDAILLNIGVRSVEETDLEYVEVSLERLLLHAPPGHSDLSKKDCP